MPASRRSLAVTEAYRARLFQIRNRVEAEARRRFPSIDELDTSDFAAQMARVLSQAQAEAIRASGGYLSAFLSSELGRRTQAVPVSTKDLAGLSRDGRSLEESLVSPLIGVRAKLKEGADPTEAIDFGRHRAVRMVEMDLMHAARQGLLEAIEADDRVEGWQRAVAGTCGACAARATGPSGGLLFQVHPGCQCVSEPVVKGVRDRFPRLTGPELFAAASVAKQNEMLGEEAAQKVRAGTVALADLVERVPLASDQPDFITQKPAQDL